MHRKYCNYKVKGVNKKKTIPRHDKKMLSEIFNNNFINLIKFD